MAEFSPIPSDRQRIAAIAKPGLARSGGRVAQILQKHKGLYDQSHIPVQLRITVRRSTGAQEIRSLFGNEILLAS